MNLPTVFSLKLEADPALENASQETASIERQGDAVLSPDAVTDQNGRTYHGLSQGSYYLPNDADRLDLQHEMCSLILDGRLGLAPVESPGHVLDIATGTGIWAIDYAKQNPTSKVVGTDLSAIQRKTTLSNVSFVQQDVEKHDWAFDNKFDYIHLRYVVTCFDDTRVVIKKALDNLNPGGWIEFIDLEAGMRDIDGSLKGTIQEKYNNAIFDSAKKLGRDFSKPIYYKKWLEEAGFVDVVEVMFNLPCNTWPKDPLLKKIGAYQVSSIASAMVGFDHFFRAAGMSEEDINALIPSAQEGLKDLSVHYYYPMHIVYGRKPDTAN